MEKDAKEALLRVEDLKTHIRTERGLVRAVDGVDFSLPSGGVLGVVGESGCGKSMTAISIMRMEKPRGGNLNGRILFRENGGYLDLTQLDPNGRRLQAIRGAEIAMIFQEPMTSLNPIYTIGFQIMEAIMLHMGRNKTEAKEFAIEMLDRVRIPEPRQRVDEYPHQLSGGMRQRAMIAMAICCQPRLLIADEPTTALDVTIQARILDLIAELQEQSGAALILITHDLAVVAQTAEEVMVMYMGQTVERSDVKEIFREPLHPYTDGLLSSIPVLGRKDRSLTTIPGSVPDSFDLPAGCRFRPRCSRAFDKCVEMPPLMETNDNRLVRCWLYED